MALRRRIIVGGVVPALLAAAVLVFWIGSRWRAGGDGQDRPIGDPEFSLVPGARRLAWIERDGAQTPIVAPTRGYVYPRLSPDGRLALLDVRDPEHGLWQWSFADRRLTPISVGRTNDIAPVWHRSGGWAVFARGRGVAPGLFRVWTEMGGGGPVAPGGAFERLPAESNSLLMPSSLFPDGRHLLVTASIASGFDIQVIDLLGTEPTVPLVSSLADDLNAESSPDGRWVAYQSRVSGQFDIWLRSAFGSGLVQQVSTEGGTRPVWTREGTELVYLAGDGVMTARSVTGGEQGAPQIGPPEPLFEAPIYQELVGRTYDVTPDGRRFLVIIDAPNP